MACDDSVISFIFLLLEGLDGSQHVMLHKGSVCRARPENLPWQCQQVTAERLLILGLLVECRMRHLFDVFPFLF